MFIQYYSQIVNSMSAKALSPHFVAKHIISPGDQEEIFSIASSKKAAMLLLCRVSSALEFGIVDNFYKLLDIIEQYGNIDSRKVSLDIRKKLSCSTLDGKKIVCTLDEKGMICIISPSFITLNQSIQTMYTGIGSSKCWEKYKRNFILIVC